MTKSLEKLSKIVDEEFRGVDWRVIGLRFVQGWLPRLNPKQIAGLLRRLGFQIGADSVFLGIPQITGMPPLQKKFRTGTSCLIGYDVVLDLQDEIELGNNVELGSAVMILTSSHDLGPNWHRAGALQLGTVKIGNNVRVGPRAILFPNVCVGDGATIEAGAVVNREVPANAVVSGNPAVIKVPKPDEGLDAAR